MMAGRTARRIATALVMLALPAWAWAQQPTPAVPAPSENVFEPEVGMAGKDVVWVPTSPALVEKMLDLAKVTSSDYVIDLGSGDGRNVIAAARRGARGLGVEFNPDMVTLSRKLAAEAGVSDRASFVEGDMYEADISKATVMALFLLPGNLERLQDKMLALTPGTRIVMNTFTISGWEPDAQDQLGDGCLSWCLALLHIVPAKVAGVWRIEGAGELTLEQEFQMVQGTLANTNNTGSAVTGRLFGPDITLTVGTTSYTGRVDGNRISGTMTEPGATAARPWSASRVK